jgi:hypothetical protein
MGESLLEELDKVVLLSVQCNGIAISMQMFKRLKRTYCSQSTIDQNGYFLRKELSFKH